MSESGAKSLKNTCRKGREGENEAVDYLLSQGYFIVSRNYRTKQGEIDCIANDPNGVLVFLEVKCARSDALGNPAFWVTRPKQLRIARLARQYLAEHGYPGQRTRFDVITIYRGKIDHIRNAFLV
jgi:putative endonuclease